MLQAVPCLTLLLSVFLFACRNVVLRLVYYVQVGTLGAACMSGNETIRRNGVMRIQR